MYSNISYVTLFRLLAICVFVFPLAVSTIETCNVLYEQCFIFQFRGPRTTGQNVHKKPWMETVYFKGNSRLTWQNHGDHEPSVLVSEIVAHFSWTECLFYKMCITFTLNWMWFIFVYVFHVWFSGHVEVSERHENAAEPVTHNSLKTQLDMHCKTTPANWWVIHHTFY